MENAPIGQRFSVVYLERGKPLNDSLRFRTRLAERCLDAFVDLDEINDFLRQMSIDVGTEFSYGSQGVRNLFAHGQLRDVLDAITVFHDFLAAIRRGQERFWHQFVARAMREENVGYRLDKECGVHYFVDEEFERARASTLAVLDHAALKNARSSFQDAYPHMDGHPADTKAAVRSMFEAAEIIAKQLVPGSQNLNAKMAEGVLKQKCIAAIAASDAIETRSLEGMFKSLAEWINAMHNYRHGQPEDEPVAPGEAL